MNITDAHVERISKMMSFEYNWWKDRGWLNAKSFKHLVNMPIPENFDVKERLLAGAIEDNR